MDCNKIAQTNLEFFVDNEYPITNTNGSISVNKDDLIAKFKVGKLQRIKIKLINKTSKPQVIQIQPMSNKMFKLPDETTVSILPNCSKLLTIKFVSDSITEYKDFLKLKNPTGNGNMALEVCAVPELNFHLPNVIDYGNVHIGMTVSKKLVLYPRIKKYRFRTLVPVQKEGLIIEPTSGEVEQNIPIVITVTYTACSYVTLSADLILYFSDMFATHHKITINAVTKPTHCFSESESLYRDEYLEQLDKFMCSAKYFGDKSIKNTQQQFITESPPQHYDDWNEKILKKLNSHMDNCFKNQEPIKLKERSVRMNHIEICHFEFNPMTDGNWWRKFQAYDKFVKISRKVIIKIRLEKRLKLLKSITPN
ncbi:uncharacterized protein LOC126894910 [Daktulosphaira vitifoliae]|uniref:uncharacterized protein LOC126894910 n=1 Tax=Daktulosphaira vitifoliae TaxID=58002 RepID=UPI0021AA58C3|nr:uncharacterized protein LOC126894910 [Daktulosphaira vitifoliae]